MLYIFMAAAESEGRISFTVVLLLLRKVKLFFDIARGAYSTVYLLLLIATVIISTRATRRLEK